MLTINTNVNSVNNKRSNINFGTNLILGQGVAEHLKTQPDEAKKIEEFKDYLAQDGKNWNAELTYDSFAVSIKETEALIMKDAKFYDWNAEKQAAKNISLMTNPQEASDFIEKLTDDSNRNVRRDAAGMAGKINDPKIAVALIEKLMKKDDIDVRRSAANSIRDIKDPNILIKLIDKYTKVSDSEIRESAARAASNIEDEKLRDATFEKLSNSSNADVKRGVSSIIYKTDDVKLFETLVEKFSKDEDLQVQEHALFAIVDAESDKIKKNPALFDSIIEAGVKSSDSNIRRAAAYSAGKHSDTKKAIELTEELLKDEDIHVRRDATFSIGHIKDHEQAKLLIDKILKYSDAETKSNLDGVFKHNKNSELHEYVTEQLINDKDPKVRYSGAYSISSIKDPQKASVLAEKLLKDVASQNREVAARRISEIKDKTVRNTLLNKYIHSDDLSIKLGLTESLKELGKDEPETAEKFAIMLSKDADKAIQKEAKDVLDGIAREEKTSHYSLNITDGDKVVGQKKVLEHMFGGYSIWALLLETYEYIVDNKNQ